MMYYHHLIFEFYQMSFLTYHTIPGTMSTSVQFHLRDQTRARRCLQSKIMKHHMVKSIKQKNHCTSSCQGQNHLDHSLKLQNPINTNLIMEISDPLYKCKGIVKSLPQKLLISDCTLIWRTFLYAQTNK
jgi:hypothetical protein